VSLLSATLPVLGQVPLPSWTCPLENKSGTFDLPDPPRIIKTMELYLRLAKVILFLP